MGKRRQSRELALKFLYQFDVLTENDKADNFDLDLRLGSFMESNPDAREAEVKEFLELLVKGVFENIEGLDEMITKYSDNWKISRMSRIDRNILRLAFYEMLNLRNIPYPVTINEAVDIAKKYGTAESGSFINGIVDKARKSLEQSEKNDK